MRKTTTVSTLPLYGVLCVTPGLLGSVLQCHVDQLEMLTCIPSLHLAWHFFAEVPDLVENFEETAGQ